MNPIVKICGLSTEETLEAALDAGADMIGLVMFPPSPRFVAPEVAGRLAEKARNRAEIVLLTVDMAQPQLAEIIAEVNPDWLQFHGSETPEAVASAKKCFGRKVMKAVGVGNTGDLRRVGLYETVADCILLDAKAPKDAVLPGGRGVRFDWKLLDGFESNMPFLLSGGLDVDNVEMALASVQGAAGVDVSSGVETAPGRKNPERIRAFVAVARRAGGISSSRVVEGAAP